MTSPCKYPPSKEQYWLILTMWLQCWSIVKVEHTRVGDHSDTDMLTYCNMHVWAIVYVSYTVHNMLLFVCIQQNCVLCSNHWSMSNPHYHTITLTTVSLLRSTINRSSLMAPDPLNTTKQCSSPLTHWSECETVTWRRRLSSNVWWAPLSCRRWWHHLSLLLV